MSKSKAENERDAEGAGVALRGETTGEVAAPSSLRAEVPIDEALGDDVLVVVDDDDNGGRFNSR